MILINLLPHREEARKRAKEDFYSKLVLAVIFGVVLSAVGWGLLNWQVSQQESRNERLLQANAKIDKEIKAVSDAQAVIDALQARREAVENLQTDRNLLVRWMEDLVRLSPDGVYLTKAVQKGLTLDIDAVALDNDQISKFISNTSLGNQQTITNSQWTGSIVAKMLNVDSKEPTQRVLTFSLRFDLVRNAGKEPVVADKK